MITDFFYGSAAGRAMMNSLQAVGFYNRCAFLLRTKASKRMIPRYIRKNQIDMRPYGDREYGSFAEFFSRKKDGVRINENPNVLISPCDSLLSIYEIRDDLVIPMKGSRYDLGDLLPRPDLRELFRSGLCMVFRLEASFYHRFCCFDNAKIEETHFIPGQLHSVQPIALRTVPVYRLNRRWCSILETEHFGVAAQIEVGAMFVGGVEFSKNDGSFRRGEDMGSFELAGSTLVLLLNASVRKRLAMYERFRPTFRGKEEMKVSMGEGLGILRLEQTDPTE